MKTLTKEPAVFLVLKISIGNPEDNRSVGDQHVILSDETRQGKIQTI